MNPLKISFFILLCLLSLFALTFFSMEKAEQGYMKESGFPLGSWWLDYPTTSAFMMETPAENPVNRQLDSMLDNIESVVLTTEEEPALTPAESRALSADSLQTLLEMANRAMTTNPDFDRVVPDYSRIDTTRISRISYPGEKTAFLKTLKSRLESARCRILHFGDSQLEGDRISGYLRNRLQLLYGGSGPGFLPVRQVYDEIKAVIGHSENWERYAVFDPTRERFRHKAYGVYTSVSRFTPRTDLLDSLNRDTLTLQEAYIDIAPGTMTYRKARSYDKVVLHYGNVTDTVWYQVSDRSGLLMEGTLPLGEDYASLTIPVRTSDRKLQLKFRARISPDIYGLSLEGKQGVLLDNIAMRGASGTEFSRLNKANFKQMMSALDPGVLFFQYGGNALPYLKDSLEVNRYAGYVKANLKLVQRSAPGAPVIFIGPSDMSTLYQGDYMTYPLLTYLDEQLEQACHESGVAYWSMFEAMGGAGSMNYWVEHGLAQNDYTHFSGKGSALISELFFTALYLDLQQRL